MSPKYHLILNRGYLMETSRSRAQNTGNKYHLMARGFFNKKYNQSIKTPQINTIQKKNKVKWQMVSYKLVDCIIFFYLDIRKIDMS